MKKNLLVLLVAVFVVAGTMVAIKARAAAIQHSANGQGTFLADDGNGGTTRRTFSFSARIGDDGTVSGNAVLHTNAFTYGKGNQPYAVQIDISCMKVVGNTAYFGGMPRKTNEPDPVYSDAVYFIAQDNGEPGKGRDKISYAYFYDFDPAITGDPQLCQGLPDTSPGGLNDSALVTIDQGNVQVR